MSLPQVVSENPSQFTSELVAAYESATDKTLYPAQVEHLMVDLMVYCLCLIQAGINDAGRQNLPQFARAPMLTYWGEFLGVPRLPAQPARTTLRFSLAATLSIATVIAKSTRIDGAGIAMVTQAEVVIPAGSLFVDVLALADTTGSGPNGLPQNTFKEPFDDLSVGVTVTNISMVGGGAEIEDIERWRERIMLAFNRPSAGSVGAYRLLAKSADIRVIDLAVVIMEPGWVRLVVLTDEFSQSEVVAAVDRAARADDKKPLTDRVDVVACTPIETPVTIVITPLKKASLALISEAAEQALTRHKEKLSRTAGLDTVFSQVSALVQNLAGVKRVSVTGDFEISPFHYAVLTWTLTFTEAEDA